MSNDAGKRLRELRTQRGWTQQELARRAKVKQQTVAKIESGRTLRSRHLHALAVALGVPIGELDPIQAVPDEEPGSPQKGGNDQDLLGDATWFFDDPVPLLTREVTERKTIVIPVFATFFAGNTQVRLRHAPIDYIDQPEPLRGAAPYGYALYLSEDTMVPAYEPGDLVLVHPKLPPLIGTDCVLHLRSTPGHLPRPTLVRRLTGQDEESWRARTWNPPQEALWSKEEWQADRVVGVYRRR
jgi:transcriptional regulator with XRE-family HTH domain